MKSSAYGTPLLLQDGNVNAILQQEAYDEATIQELVFKHPSCLPISDIDETYSPVIPVCLELNTPVGPLDIFMITPNGDLVIIETKLWRNPEARRVVVAQILDYAKELSKWSYADLQREVNRRLGRSENSLYEIARASNDPLTPDEMVFVDAVSRNLRRGNFLLLVVGDGIREGAAGIAEFLSSTGHFNFTFAMIELAVYKGEGSETLIIPRTTAKTVELQKLIVEIPPELTLRSNTSHEVSEVSQAWTQEKQFYNIFWEEFVAELNFDDPSQPHPKIPSTQNLFIYPSRSTYAWISAYFSKSSKRVGVYFRCQNSETGQSICSKLDEHIDSIMDELGADIISSGESVDGMEARLPCDDVFDAGNREAIKAFFDKWLNTYVNVFRPRMRDD